MSCRATEREGGGSARSYPSSLVRTSLSLDRVWEGGKSSKRCKLPTRLAGNLDGFKGQRGPAERKHDEGSVDEWERWVVDRAS